MNGTGRVLPQRGNGDGCIDLPAFRRLRYFYGQMLSAQDFQTEQHFFREKLKLHNRCLHGYGTICGLLVEPVPFPEDCFKEEEEEERKLREELDRLLDRRVAAGSYKASAPALPMAGAAGAEPASASERGADRTPGPVRVPAAISPTAPESTGASGKPADSQPALPETPAEDLGTLDAHIEELRRRLEALHKQHCREAPRTRFRIDCGLALDCCGNELVVRRPLVVDVLERLSADDYRRVRHGASSLYVSICYCERPLDPVRPVITEACGATADCSYSKLQDDVTVRVSVDPPAADCRCETCCEPCTEPCLLLARIDAFCPGHPIREHHVHNHVRRPVGLYQPTTIVGVSWQQGHHYTQDEAKLLLGTDHERGDAQRGLEIRFSRPVLSSSIRPGVVDVWVIEGGRGRSAEIYHKAGEFVDLHDHPLTDRIVYRDRTGETLEPGDRVLITVRCEFILDECCRPVDGENWGGRVPILEEYAERFRIRPSPTECGMPPRGYGPWTSGDGYPGGTFEGWFYIREREHPQGGRHGRDFDEH
ncbi:hypothetical protein [Paraburkholderia sp. BR14374]|uniref:hypothetical protein n=1 Tax=Paraburkholderia sp. BR14374 TaxID=3237007 RepID=UPI0034CEB5FF